MPPDDADVPLCACAQPGRWLPPKRGPPAASPLAFPAAYLLTVLQQCSMRRPQGAGVPLGQSQWPAVLPFYAPAVSLCRPDINDQHAENSEGRPRFNCFFSLESWHLLVLEKTPYATRCLDTDGWVAAFEGTHHTLSICRLGVKAATQDILVPSAGLLRPWGLPHPHLCPPSSTFFSTRELSSLRRVRSSALTVLVTWAASPLRSLSPRPPVQRFMALDCLPSLACLLAAFTKHYIVLHD